MLWPCQSLSVSLVPTPWRDDEGSSRSRTVSLITFPVMRSESHMCNCCRHSQPYGSQHRLLHRSLGLSLLALLPYVEAAFPASLPTCPSGFCARRWQRPQLCHYRGGQLPRQQGWTQDPIAANRPGQAESRRDGSDCWAHPHHDCNLLVPKSIHLRNAFVSLLID